MNKEKTISQYCETAPNEEELDTLIKETPIVEEKEMSVEKEKTTFSMDMFGDLVNDIENGKYNEQVVEEKEVVPEEPEEQLRYYINKLKPIFKKQYEKQYEGNDNIPLNIKLEWLKKPARQI